MSRFQVLLVAGTHGNEINAPWLIDQWVNKPALVNTHGVKLLSVIGNPAARKAGLRYLDRDLNRSFRSDLLVSNDQKDHEVMRAKELLRLYGAEGSRPCQVAIDLHSTTSAMGSSLVVYGRRPTDLAFAALVQAKMGLPVYLHEGDQSQQGFLVESWPCGLVIEIGPVPQMVLQAKIVQQTRLAVEGCLEVLARVMSSSAVYPDQLVVHRHLRSIDLPRDSKGRPEACLHPEIQGGDWRPIQQGSPLFLRSDGEVNNFQVQESLFPVFVNEAAYAEKRIAMSLTRREVWSFSKDWQIALKTLVGLC